jgi:hypothetical protein
VHVLTVTINGISVLADCSSCKVRSGSSLIKQHFIAYDRNSDKDYLQLSVTPSPQAHW